MLTDQYYLLWRDMTWRLSGFVCISQLISSRHPFHLHQTLTDDDDGTYFHNTIIICMRLLMNFLSRVISKDACIGVRTTYHRAIHVEQSSFILYRACFILYKTTINLRQHSSSPWMNSITTAFNCHLHVKKSDPLTDLTRDFCLTQL